MNEAKIAQNSRNLLAESQNQVVPHHTAPVCPLIYRVARVRPTGVRLVFGDSSSIRFYPTIMVSAAWVARAAACAACRPALMQGPCSCIQLCWLPTQAVRLKHTASGGTGDLMSQSGTGLKSPKRTLQATSFGYLDDGHFDIALLPQALARKGRLVRTRQVGVVGSMRWRLHPLKGECLPKLEPFKGVKASRGFYWLWRFFLIALSRIAIRPKQDGACEHRKTTSPLMLAAWK